MDFRHALRVFKNSPGFALLVVATLALGIGANTAIFSVVNSILLRALPYRQPEGLVHIWADNPAIHGALTDLPASFADFHDWQQRDHTFSSMAAMRFRETTVGGVQPERVGAAEVGGGFFELLGIRPLLGRTITAEDDHPGPSVVVISYGLWQRYFSGDPGAVGRAIVLDGASRTVIGVMPAGMNYPRQAELPKGYAAVSATDVWRPIGLSAKALADRRGHGLIVLGRLKPGVPIETSKAEMSQIAATLAQQYPDSNKGWGARVVPMREQIVGRVRPVLLMLLGAVGLVLLIACANVASLLLARATARSRELAVRAALGASRSRLFRQLLSESLVLALAGGVAGLFAAVWSVQALVAMGPSDIPRLKETSIDPVVLLFTLAVTIGTGVIFGLFPALTSSRANLNDALKQGGRSSTAGNHRARRVLVVAEVALAVVMLAGAGLLLRSFAKLLAVDPGFDADRVLTLTIRTDNKYRTSAQQAEFFDRLTIRLASLPGVAAAGGIDGLPFSGDADWYWVNMEGRPDPPLGQEASAANRVITSGYFRAMGTPLLSGRLFSDADRPDSEQVAIVSEGFAQYFLPGESILGRRMTLDIRSPKPKYLRIVGVVGDVKLAGMDDATRLQFYRPIMQDPQDSMSMALRAASGDPLQLAQAARAAVRALDPDLAISDVKPMQGWIMQSLERRRFQMTLIGGFAALALLLTIVGLYGVISYSVSQRTAEIGVRIALGASSSDVARMVLKEGTVFVMAGLVLGLGGALALTRFIASQLYAVSPQDPATLGVVSLVLAAVALAACWIPARRATRVDPVVALRQ